MAHHSHPGHSHQHSEGCGHTAIRHGDHLDFVHEGHLHRHVGQEFQECQLEASEQNPERCTPGHACDIHATGHQHGPGCGHEAVPHAGHTDYLVEGHLHHHHGDHCDDHGRVALSA